jgi:hypothetical protein
MTTEEILDVFPFEKYPIKNVAMHALVNSYTKGVHLDFSSLC